MFQDNPFEVNSIGTRALINRANNIGEASGATSDSLSKKRAKIRGKLKTSSPDSPRLTDSGSSTSFLPEGASDFLKKYGLPIAIAAVALFVLD